MEQKYYTPTLEEIHSGFEYEKFDRKPLQEEGVWRKVNEFSNDYDYEDNPHYAISKDIDSGHIRVKILDHDDILECGFKEWCKEDVYELWDKDKRYWQLHTKGYADREDGAIALDLHEGNNGVNGNSQNILLFCKNKSELKRLMNQLSIA